MADIDTDTISIGIDLEHFWVPVSVSVSIWDFSETWYQSQYQLGVTWVFGGAFHKNRLISMDIGQSYVVKVSVSVSVSIKGMVSVSISVST